MPYGSNFRQRRLWLAVSSAASRFNFATTLTLPTDVALSLACVLLRWQLKCWGQLKICGDRLAVWLPGMVWGAVVLNSLAPWTKQVGLANSLLEDVELVCFLFPLCIEIMITALRASGIWTCLNKLVTKCAIGEALIGVARWRTAKGIPSTPVALVLLRVSDGPGDSCWGRRGKNKLPICHTCLRPYQRGWALGKTCLFSGMIFGDKEFIQLSTSTVSSVTLLASLPSI